VPPDALAPMLRQLVNQFIHDRARPEVAAVGLNAVREICARCPLVMDEDLLQDLTQYKKSRDKPVSNAARGLIALFREIAPGLLDKKDRGKAADMSRTLKNFGEAEVVDRIDGVDLLQRDILKRKREEEAAKTSSEEEYSDEDDEEEEEDEEEEDEEEEDEEEEEEPTTIGKRGRESDEDAFTDPDAPPPKVRKNGKLSLAELKRRHKAMMQRRKEEEEAEARAEQEAEEAELGGPVEQERILTDEDFKRIKALKTERQLNAALSKAGAVKASNVA
jgi:protein SDA1